MEKPDDLFKTMTFVGYFNRLKSLLHVGSLKSKTLSFFIFCVSNQIIVQIDDGRRIGYDDFFCFKWGFDSSYSPVFILGFFFNVDGCIHHLFFLIFGLVVFWLFIFFFYFPNPSAHFPE